VERVISASRKLAEILIAAIRTERRALTGAIKTLAVARQSQREP